MKSCNIKGLRTKSKSILLCNFTPFYLLRHEPFNPGHCCMDVKMSKGNVIPSLNGSQLYSSHPKQKCTKIYPEETAPGPRPLPYMGKILTFDRKIVEDSFFYQNDCI